MMNNGILLGWSGISPHLMTLLMLNQTNIQEQMMQVYTFSFEKHQVITLQYSSQDWSTTLFVQ